MYLLIKGAKQDIGTRRDYLNPHYAVKPGLCS
jgi:hypothetical protein